MYMHKALNLVSIGKVYSMKLKVRQEVVCEFTKRRPYIRQHRLLGQIQLCRTARRWRSDDRARSGKDCTLGNSELRRSSMHLALWKVCLNPQSQEAIHESRELISMRVCPR